MFTALFSCLVSAPAVSCYIIGVTLVALICGEADVEERLNR